MENKSFSIQPTYIDAGAIAVYESLWDLSSSDIENFISELPSKGFLPSQVGADTGSDHPRNRQSVRTSYELSINKFAKTSDLINKINDKCSNLVDMAIKNYKEIFKIEEELDLSEPHILLRYVEGNGFAQHYDGGTETKRCVSVLIYLNDNYEGGELEFPNFKLKIKPKAGTIILFPSNYAYGHIAKPVIFGTKYVITTWRHDR